MKPARVRQALQAWRSTFAAERVLNAEEATQAYSPCTTGVFRRMAGGLRLRSTEEVAEAVRIAARFSVPLYPISTGHNWGLGSANPVVDGCVVVDLSGMRRIVDFDRALGLVTVEPGVTQDQLYRYLKRNKSSYLVPLTGAGANNSLIGNALEHGIGPTPVFDHFTAVMAVEAVLANGTIYRSALHEMGGKEVDRGYKWGIGPYVDGLFAQGSFGIVTRATIMLDRLPEALEPFNVYFQEKELGKAVCLARDLVLSNLVYAGASLRNSLSLLTSRIRYPVHEMRSGKAIPRDTVRRLADEHHLPAWILDSVIAGEAGTLEPKRRRVERMVRAYTRSPNALVIYSPDTLRQLKRIWPRDRYERLISRLRERDRPPVHVPALAYWKSALRPHPRKANPARDGCGKIWYCALVPLRPDKATGFMRMLERICPAHGLDPISELHLIPPHRCLYTTTCLLFNRDRPTEVSRAHECYRALLQEGMRNGFVPFRIAVSAMELVVAPETPFWSLVGSLKQAVDPEDILAPGRYSPTRRR